MITRARLRAFALAGLLAVSGCGGSAVKAASGPAVPVRTDVPAQFQDVAMPRPGKFVPHLDSPDILIQGQGTLPASLVKAAAAVKGVYATEQFSMATFYFEENPVTYAAVDPATFRSWTPGPTQTLDDVWNRIADGEIALRPDLRATLAGPGNYVQLGNDDDAEKAHIGAYAPLVDRSKIGAIVNERWAAKLKMPTGNALLISTGNLDPTAIKNRLTALVGNQATVQTLAVDFDNVKLTAVLTGGAVARAVGSFTYTANRDGTVNPDPHWVRDYIRTEQVPIVGTVTCNKAMLIQLRAALTEVVQRGLASKIHPSEYGGCYVPRYIAKDPAKGLSFHTFGTAIDLNVPGNQRGTVGQMDRTVVAIFKYWGFNWGGDWHYTDPMHFELARIVKVK